MTQDPFNTTYNRLHITLLSNQKLIFEVKTFLSAFSTFYFASVEWDLMNARYKTDGIAEPVWVIILHLQISITFLGYFKNEIFLNIFIVISGTKGGVLRPVRHPMEAVLHFRKSLRTRKFHLWQDQVLTSLYGSRDSYLYVWRDSINYVLILRVYY